MSFNVLLHPLFVGRLFLQNFLSHKPQVKKKTELLGGIMAVNSSKRRRQPTTKAPGRINNSQVISISSVTILAAALFLCSFNFDNIGK